MLISEQYIETEAPVEYCCPVPVARSLRFNFSWTLAGNVIYGGCQWLMLVAIARLGKPQMVGTFALAQAVAAPVILFGNLQLRALQATDTNEQFQFGHYLALRYLTTVTAFLGILIWAMLGRYSVECFEVIVIVAIAKSIESLSDVYFGLLQHHEEMSRIAKSMIVKGLLSLAGLGGGLYLTQRLVPAVAAMAGVWLLVFGAYDVRAPGFCRRIGARPVWHRRNLGKLACNAFPLGVTMMLISLNGTLPRYFMEHFQGTDRLGLFSALATIQAAGMLVVMALGNAALPRMARSFHEGNWQRFRNTVGLFLALSIALGVATVVPVLVAGDRVITWIFGREYAGQNQTLIWLALASAVSYCASVFGYAATAAERIRFQPAAYATVAAVTALGCYRLVPQYGGLGAALAMLGGSALGSVLYGISFIGTVRQLRTAKSICKALYD